MSSGETAVELNVLTCRCSGRRFWTRRRLMVNVGAYKGRYFVQDMPRWWYRWQDVKRAWNKVVAAFVCDDKCLFG